MVLITANQRSLQFQSRAGVSIVVCGIVGVVGPREASPLLLKGLRRLEYRGYDSVGVCTAQSSLHLKKGAGKIEDVHQKLDFLTLPGTMGIAHTRWATHGGVSDLNAHPHLSCGSELAAVHNGIVENYLGLKKWLISRGHVFRSETDSEVISHLVEDYLKGRRKKVDAVRMAAKKLKGSFAFLVVFNDSPSLVCVRKDSPLVVGVGSGENFVASDVLAFIDDTDNVIFLDNYEIAEVTKDGVAITDFDGRRKKKAVTKVAWEASDISKEEYSHFTMKEIHEQAESIPASLYQDQDKIDVFCREIEKADNVYLAASGTSYHASLVFKQLLAQRSRVRAEAILASEFAGSLNLVGKGDVLVAVSQSGETADVLEAVRAAKSSGAKILSVVNVMNSSLDRESDLNVYLHCGPEIGVAATKSFTSQLTVLNLISMNLKGMRDAVAELHALRYFLPQILSMGQNIKAVAERYATRPDFFYVGRGIHYPIALEGALKLKEISYVHAEGLAAGELKHGTLALIDEGTPVVLINPNDRTHQETLDNGHEMKARGARIIGVTTRDDEVYDDVISIPSLREESLYPILEVIPLQMLAYYMAVERKANPDYPRNLAKSVTVK